MKRKASFCLIGLTGLVGCSVESQPVANSDPADAAVQGESLTIASDTENALTFVSLKVPNMH